MKVEAAMAMNPGITSQDQNKQEKSTGGFHDALLAATQSGKKSAYATKEIPDSQKLYNEILDTGFGKYVQEMRKEELEKKLREQILESLGLTEDDLGYLPADEIAKIEEMIQNLMQQLMADKGQDKAQEQQEKGQVYVPVIPGAIA